VLDAAPPVVGGVLDPPHAASAAAAATPAPPTPAAAARYAGRLGRAVVRPGRRPETADVVVVWLI
jgi:hypothetical protein